MTTYGEKARDRYYRHPCRRCGRVRTANPYQEERTGLCWDCFGEVRVAERLSDTEAFCTDCGLWLPHERFWKLPGSRRGLYYQCKACILERRRLRRAGVRT